MTRGFNSLLGVVPALAAFGLGLGLGLGLAGHPGEIGGAPAQAVQPRAHAAATTADRPAHDATGWQGSPESPRHSMIVDVAQRISPAVVSIGVTKTQINRLYGLFGGDPFFSPYSMRSFERNFPYLGSGFIIDDQGHVITNYHVIEDASSINVTLTDGRTYPARLMDADRFVDIALLQMEAGKEAARLPSIPLGDSEDIMIGETVLAIGNPFGPLIADPRPSVSAGVVSAVKRSFKIDRTGRVYQDMIQTDAAINPGNSGGPLVNLEGEAIGINTFIFSRSGDSASVGFSIPINRAARIIEEILEYGKIRAINLDFAAVALTPYLIKALNLGVTQGALVWSVDVGGAADQAGLRPGDVILGVDDKRVQDAKTLLSNFLTRTVGETVKLTVVREGDVMELTYRVAEGRTD